MYVNVHFNTCTCKYGREVDLERQICACSLIALKLYELHFRDCICSCIVSSLQTFECNSLKVVNVQRWLKKVLITQFKENIPKNITKNSSRFQNQSLIDRLHKVICKLKKDFMINSYNNCPRKKLLKPLPYQRLQKSIIILHTKISPCKREKSARDAVLSLSLH